ncbi:hypothetical protein TWF694_007431 [Orbilia ellipsospora]|uniref:Uncharacterized protein n=1 Tax=Orbilia ellipsospora TaxID=2528407 RepID=A0AAV9XJ55_9PEZI
MDGRRFRNGHSRANSASVVLDYSSTTDRQTSHIVTPTAQIGPSGRNTRHHDPPPHLPHHHGHHHHHANNHVHGHPPYIHKQAIPREGPTPFDDDGDTSSVDSEIIQRDANGSYGDNFEIPHRMLRIIMPELFEHLNEAYNEPHLTESVNFSSRYAHEECEKPRHRIDLNAVRALNKARVASIADDAWMYEAEEDPNPARWRRQLYQSR